MACIVACIYTCTAIQLFDEEYIYINTCNLLAINRFLFCRFNYRSTHYMSEHGFYDFLNWFDDRAWYPLGRIVGGTVCDIIYK